MARTTATRHWQAASDLVWTRFSDSPNWVVYHPASCDAHLVTDSARRLLELLGDGRAWTIDELVARMTPEHSTLSHEEVAAATEDVLASMDASGLLRPVKA